MREWGRRMGYLVAGTVCPREKREAWVHGISACFVIYRFIDNISLSRHLLRQRRFGALSGRFS